MAYFDVDGATFNEQLRMLETTDPVHADTFNTMFGQLINNDVALKEAVAGALIANKTEQAKFLLGLHKTGKKYGCHWDAYSIDSSSVGTRLGDAVGMEAYASTDAVKANNDFEAEGPFYHLEVNGYVDSDGEFVVTYIKDIDPEFSRTDNDTWCLFLTHYFKITIDANGESLYISDTCHTGYVPEAAAIRTDGTIRPFVAMAKYQDSNGSDGKAASVSGNFPSYNNSHNSMITRFHTKGTQYCSTTAQDKAHIDNLFYVAFATRNMQSVMAGCTSYNIEKKVTVTETGVERVILSNSDASGFVVGSTVGLGTSGHDRSVVTNAVITSIEEYDANNKILNLDNGGVTFNVTADTTYVSTFPWKTGACDDVLGACGSPVNNTSGKYPCIIFGVEMFNGGLEVLSNVIMQIASHVMTPYICYDCVDLATSVTADYEAVGYSVADCGAAWKYISQLGFDVNNPCCRFATGLDATSSTGYADAQYTEDIANASDGLREVLSRGALNYGGKAGLACAYLTYGLSGANWGCAARLSASGRCAQAAA